VKVALAIRAAMLAVALLVMVAPVSYLAREQAGGGEHHQHLTYVDTLGGDGMTSERAVAIWWVIAAAALLWAWRGGGPRVVRGLFWALVVASSAIVFVRPIWLTGHVDRLTGSGAVDLAVLVYLIAMIAGAITEYTATESRSQ
jgi:hypothetical protein